MKKYTHNNTTNLDPSFEIMLSIITFFVPQLSQVPPAMAPSHAAPPAQHRYAQHHHVVAPKLSELHLGCSSKLTTGEIPWKN